MTAIAYRDGILAADRGVWRDHLLIGERCKIQRLEDGRLFAAAGRTADAQACAAWLEAGEPPEKRPPAADKEYGFCALVIGPGIGDVIMIEQDFRPFRAPKAQWHTAGCHGEFLTGAMAAGASAATAVLLAVQFGDGAAGPVDVVYLDPNERGCHGKID